MDAVMEVLGFINDNILWGIPLIVAIMGTGILLTIRTRALQVRKFPVSISTTIVPTVKSIVKPNKKKKNGKEKTVSQFEAFATAISGTVGTGNIVGVAGALISGGPGAIFWMWVSAFFGLVTNYSENVLGLYFRKKDKDGEISGGPMYYISNGLKCKWLGMLFAAFCGFAAVGMGMVQSNTISETLQSTIAGNTNSLTSTIVAWVVAAVVAILLVLVVIGGIKRIGKVASLIVPFMALLFLIMALIIIFMNVVAIPAAFASIFVNAFSFKSVSGGLFGYAIMLGMRYGFARGVFSNEAGLGSSVIAHSASETKEPVQQGLWGIFEVFLDTFVICTITAISCIIVSGNSNIDFANISENEDLVKSTIASSVFTSSFGTFGSVVFSIILPLFAFTTILAWSYYGQKSIEYLFGEKYGKIAGLVFKVLYVVLVAVGALAKSDFVWLLDDMFNALMALPNLIGLIGLSGLVVKISKNYFDRKSGKELEPMLSAYPERNAELIKELQQEQEKQAE